MIVISDTSPLTYLPQIARFDLLSALYEEVVIPPAVERELRKAAYLHEGLDWSVLRVLEPKSAELDRLKAKRRAFESVQRFGKAETRKEGDP